MLEETFCSSNTFHVRSSVQSEYFIMAALVLNSELIVAGFFPETSKKDVVRSFQVIVFLILLTFLPTILQHQGIALYTKNGFMIFAFYYVYGIWLYRNFPFQTKAKLSEVIRIPRVLVALLGGFFAAFLATHVVIFNTLAAFFVTALFATAIEYVCMCVLAWYISLLLCFLLKGKRGQNQAS